MNTQVKSKEVLIKELHKLHKEYDLLKTSYSKEIIERRQTEQTLEESEIKYRNLVDNVGEGIGIVDINEEFVEKHGGHIWVESEVGRGSDFKFTLPVSGEQANAMNN